MTKYDNETNLVEDEYDDLDDFIVGTEDGDNAVEEEEDDGDEEEQLPEVEEEEEEEPPVGQQEILSLRERLKAGVRRRNQANAADAAKASCSSSVQAPVRAPFGTFFGPSKPALAPRLIEAGCSSIMKEIQNVPSRKDASPPASKTQANASAQQQKPKIVSQEKRKVDTLRQNRDYSNLFSDDADTPPPTKEQPDNRPVMAPKSDAEVRGMQPMQSAGKSKVSTNQPARISKDHGSAQSRVQSKAGSVREPLPNGRKSIAAARNGSSLTSMKKTQGLQSSSDGQKPQCSMQIKRPQASPAGQRQQQPAQNQRLLQQASQSQRKQNHGPQSPQVRRMNSSMQSQQSVQKGSAQSHEKSKLGQKQLCPSSEPKPSRTNEVYDDHSKKKGAVKRKLRDEQKAMLMIRNMFKYDPGKYADSDDDISNMEADYASIQMEERRSAKLGKKEDEEQFLLIQEEKRRERARKKKKVTEGTVEDPRA